MRSEGRAAKFGERIGRLFNRTPSIANIISKTADAVIQSTAKFLASFGSETVRLNKISRERLASQDVVEQNKLKTRAIAELQSNSRDELRSIVEEYARGRISLTALEANMQATIRRQTLATTIIGVGGVYNLTENVLLAIQRQISDEFRLLDGFINDISGRELTNKDRARAVQYANSAHTIAQTAYRQFMLDNNLGVELEEHRRLGAAEHCPDCVELEAAGWQPAGYLPPIGQGTVCGNSCKCWIQVRTKVDALDTNTFTQFDNDI